mmetsp:Transcript_13678/g.34375  ORF Transcript_13678/g.34375 Transcript_13678/m.34375 type:complete len:309 (-) Transcript_13678:115-1041(-)
MLGLGTMLILAGCLLYSVFNAMLFAFVYYRRQQMERMEASFTGTGPDPPMQLLEQQLQVLPINQKSLTHNTWLHEVAMRQICTNKKLVGVKQLKPDRGTGSGKAGGQHHANENPSPSPPPESLGPIRERDIFLRIRNLYGPFVDVKIVSRVFHENRKFDTPILVYRYDEESAQGEILDLVIKPSRDLLQASFAQIPVKADANLRRVFEPFVKEKEGKKWRLSKSGKGKGEARTSAGDEVSVVYKHQTSDEMEDETSENVCGICFDHYPNAILHPCKHRICVNCFNLLQVKSCPYCRKPIEKCNYELLI